MRIRFFSASVIVGLTLVSSTARAEPITFAFDVHIQQRCNPSCGEFLATFPFYMTIDSIGSGSEFAKSYGVPTFSPIPLDRPAVQPGGSILTTATDAVFSGEPFKWRRKALVWSGVALETADASYIWNSGFTRMEDNVSPLPELTAASLATFLGSMRGEGFFFYTYTRLAPTQEVLSYLGTASLRSASPTPEPGTVLLVSCGLLGLVRRRRADGAHA